jgi:hypothetical protein
VLGSSAAIVSPTPAPAAVSNLSTNGTVTIQINLAFFGGQSEVEILYFGSPSNFVSPSQGSSPGGGGSLSIGTLGSSGTGSSGSGSSGGSGNSGQTGLLTSTTSPSITPLNPTSNSLTNNTPATPVYVVPAPLAPLAVHLGSSTAAATSQSNSTLISNLDEQPPLTKFGQGDLFESRPLLSETLPRTPTSGTPSLLDFIEPYRDVTPRRNAPAQPAQPQPGKAIDQDAPKAAPLPQEIDPNIEQALGLTDPRLTQSSNSDESQRSDELTQSNTSWSFSALFGAAVVAAGGYHLAMRDSDRTSGRWIPRSLGGERPKKKRAAKPGL